MTEKRFEVILNEFDEVEYIMDKEMMEDRDFAEFIDFVEDVCNENEQLKQRNENQYQQLNQLWKLIEAKDWETLTAMDNQMKEDEERLHREWK